MKNYAFTIIINGMGDTVEDAWREAVGNFSNDPEEVPSREDYEITEEDKYAERTIGGACVSEVKVWYLNGWQFYIDAGHNSAFNAGFETEAEAWEAVEGALDPKATPGKETAQ